MLRRQYWLPRFAIYTRQKASFFCLFFCRFYGLNPDTFRPPDKDAWKVVDPISGDLTLFIVYYDSNFNV